VNRYLADPLTSKTILTAVEAWASGYILIAEFSDRDVGGRVDGVLLPYGRGAHCMKMGTSRDRTIGGSDFWYRPRLIGVEVKASRADFLKGLRGGQFDRYRDSCLAGLYVATGREVCRTQEIPADIGHLVVGTRSSGGWTCICRRHPTYRDVELSAALVWRVVFHVADKSARETRDLEVRHQAAMKRVGNVAAETIFRSVRAFAGRLQ
jgi:hypothetical protein